MFFFIQNSEIAYSNDGNDATLDHYYESQIILTLSLISLLSFFIRSFFFVVFFLNFLSMILFNDN